MFGAGFQFFLRYVVDIVGKSHAIVHNAILLIIHIGAVICLHWDGWRDAELYVYEAIVF